MSKSLPTRQSLAQIRAHELRRDLTPAEKLLWSLLRDRQLAGLKFHRQQPIGHYIADFYCHERQIVVETDGETHDQRIEHDARRTEYFQAIGVMVHRFSNDDVETNLESVGVAILQRLQIDPRPWLDGAQRNGKKTERCSFQVRDSSTPSP